MATISAFEAKTRFGELLKRVARGEEVVITKHGNPVARIVPEGRGSLESVRNAATRLKQLRTEIANRSKTSRCLSYKEFRSALEEGRK